MYLLCDGRKVVNCDVKGGDYIWLTLTEERLPVSEKAPDRLIHDAGVHFDNDGRKLVIFPLRRPDITFRLKKDIDVYQLTESCETSEAMIEKYLRTCGHSTSRL